jgi:O-antigen biosynthesis protein
MVFNPIIVPVRNNLHLTRKAIKTFKAQDIGEVSILVINNASTDGTNAFLQTQRDVMQMYFDPPESVAASWNRALQWVFRAGAEYALCVNNDTELRPDTYRHLASDGGGFVTAVGTRDPEKIKPPYVDPDPAMKRFHPDFSCYLIRRETYNKIGLFDEAFLIAYCEDADYHIRMHKADVHAYALELPFLHHGAQTIRNAEPGEIRKIQIQADRNREYFKKKYGFAVASKEYYDFFKVDPPVEEATAPKETSTSLDGVSSITASSMP